tara:strand:+ start:1577 stop:2149 length:573 start_codon:yes stop_codon:yes gene_type:complete
MKIDDILDNYQKENSSLYLNKRFKYKNSFRDIKQKKKNNSYSCYSYELQDLVRELTNDNYQVLSESFVDNIFLFYKIINKKLFLTLIKMKPIYFDSFSYEENFSILNYNINIIDIESFNLLENDIYIISDKEIKFEIFNKQNAFLDRREPTKEELKILKKEQQETTKSFIKLNKKINSILKNNFSIILSL